MPAIWTVSRLPQRLLLATAFVTVALLKLGSGSRLETQMRALRVGPDVQMVLVVAFFGIATVLLTRWWRFGVLATLWFCACAVIYLTVLRAGGIDLETCGCFGRRRVALVPHLAVVLGLILLSMSAAAPPSTDMR